MISERSAYIVVLITASSVQEAEKLAKALVEKRLIACGNIISDIRSVFWWQNSIETAQEALLIVKSREPLFPEIVSTVQSLHSYETPEIIALPILLGSESYLTWLYEETQARQM